MDDFENLDQPETSDEEVIVPEDEFKQMLLRMNVKLPVEVIEGYILAHTRQKERLALEKAQKSATGEKDMSPSEIKRRSYEDLFSELV